MEVVQLFSTPNVGWARLRGILGSDEQSVESSESAAAIALLDRLLAPDSPIGPGRAVELTVADRDRLMAAVYCGVYGPRVQNVLRCQGCGADFDIDFSVAELLRSVRPERLGVRESAPGIFDLPDGRRFRLPTGRDEGAVRGLDPAAARKALWAECVVEGDPDVDPDRLEEAMEAVAPILELDLDARCPECGNDQSVHFDIQSYLLQSIIGEQRRRAVEVHRLASAYGWTLREILDLPRSQRRTYVELVDQELSPQRRWAI